jgi:hypothetical protein
MNTCGKNCFPKLIAALRLLEHALLLSPKTNRPVFQSLPRPSSTSRMVIPFFIACEYFSLILIAGCTFLELHPERPNTKPGSAANGSITRTSQSVTGRARGHGRPIPTRACSCPAFILRVDRCPTRIDSRAPPAFIPHAAAPNSLSPGYSVILLFE